MSQSLLAIIGGTGLTEYPDLEIENEIEVKTELGAPSAPLVFGKLHGQNVVFLARHGHPHALPPNKVNYRANILALKNYGVTEVIAVNAVGGITDKMDAQTICVPNQIVDYTHGRDDTYFDGVYKPLDHIDFTHPYCDELSQKLVVAAGLSSVSIEVGGVYAATQGPRLETIAEIDRLERDGCDVVGMTGMPEAALARELDMSYACIALVVNKAAGKSETLITMDDIRSTLALGIEDVKSIISTVAKGLNV